MEAQILAELLERVRRGRVSVRQALEKLRHLPFEDLGFAKVDHHRALRQGFPEVILGEGKEPSQIAAIARAMQRRRANVLITRLAPEKMAKLRKQIKGLRYHPRARVATWVGGARTGRDPDRLRGNLGYPRSGRGGVDGGDHGQPGGAALRCRGRRHSPPPGEPRKTVFGFRPYCGRWHGRGLAQRGCRLGGQTGDCRPDKCRLRGQLPGSLRPFGDAQLLRRRRHCSQYR